MKKKLLKIYHNVINDIKKLGYNKIKDQDNKLIVNILGREKIGKQKGDKVQLVRDYSEQIFSNFINLEEKDLFHDSIIDYSYHSIFKRRMFEVTTSINKNIPQPDLTDTINNEKLSIISGKLKAH